MFHAQLNTGLGNIRVDLLHESPFIEGSITPSISPLYYDFLVFANNYGGNAIAKARYGHVQAALSYNANNAIYTDVFDFVANPQTISIEFKRRMIAESTGIYFINDSAEPVTTVFGIKLS